MPKESQPVILRTSASADGWWAKMADAEVNKSFRVLNGQISLFTDDELKDLPFRRQLRPANLCTLTFPPPSPPPLSSFNSSLPGMISSTEITRLVMAKEIKTMGKMCTRSAPQGYSSHAEESEWCVHSEQSVGCVSGRGFLVILLECEPRSGPVAVPSGRPRSDTSHATRAT